MAGHQLIAMDGRIVAQKMPFGQERALYADIDCDHLAYEHRQRKASHMAAAAICGSNVRASQDGIYAPIGKNPFLPEEGGVAREASLDKIFEIQSHGLAHRVAATGQKGVVLGLSGGLDSALALLAACRASDLLGCPRDSFIHAITMPGPASTSQTQQNALALARSVGASSKQINIDGLVDLELEKLSHSLAQDVAYENIQARARTSLLFNYANMHSLMVLGTGTLSELALGWCTYNADQQSNYNVNAAVPKTVARALVESLSSQESFKQAEGILASILETPMSPELTKGSQDAITQSTESVIGPYELHDFFIYYTLRYGDLPAKIAYLASQAFNGQYTPEEILKWLKVFIGRFKTSQFKRDTLPNGPQVFCVSLSPRSGWAMPSDLQ
jgi:NAD+ synthase (glutamine-hydrolysing)